MECLQAFLLGARHKRESVENKPASFLVMFLGKALNQMPSSLCGRQMGGAKQSTRRGDPV